MPTNDKVQLIIVRGIIASQDKAMQDEIAMVAAELRAVISKYSDAGCLALALLGAEIAAEELP